MKHCLRCGKGGLFLKLYDGYCKECAAITSPTLPFSVPREVLSLLWFNDGKYKNFNSDIKLIGKIGNAETEIRLDGSEPSLISLTVPIAESSEGCEPLGYFPVYYQHSFLPLGYELSESQRRKYFEVLNDLDNPANDVGYIFLFYYGLERHLLCGKAEEAFNMIMRLRRVYKNKSFLTYSFTAILCAAIFNQRQEWAETLIDSFDEEAVAGADINALLLLKTAFGSDLTAKQIMLFARRFSFTNTRYIKDYPKLFEACLKRVIEHTEKQGAIGLLNKSELKIKTISCFANQSIAANIPIPDFTANKALTEYYRSLLLQAHEEVKSQLKDSAAVSVDKPKPRPAKNFSIGYAEFKNDFNGNLEYQLKRDYAELRELYDKGDGEFYARIGSNLLDIYMPTNAFWLLRDLRLLAMFKAETENLPPAVLAERKYTEALTTLEKVYEGARNKQGSENIRLLSSYIEYRGGTVDRVFINELDELQRKERREQTLKQTTDISQIKNKEDLKLFLELKYEAHGYTLKQLTKGTAFVAKKESQTILIESKFAASKTSYAAIETALTTLNYLNIDKLIVFSMAGFTSDLTEFARDSSNIKLLILSEWQAVF